MKKYFRCLCIILVLASCLNTTAHATENSGSRSSQFFWRYNAYLYKTSDTTFQAWFDVNGMGIMDEIGASVIRIQKSTDGVNWTTMMTYTKETSSNLIDYNTAGHTSCVSYIGSVGCYYRACIILYAKNSSGIGEITVYTEVVKL